MKKYLSLVLGSLMFFESGLSAGALSKIDKSNRGINPDNKISKMEKAKKISKKVAMVPLKASWWFVKNNLKMVGMLALDAGIALGALMVYARYYSETIDSIDSVLDEIGSTNELSEEEKTDLTDFIQSFIGRLEAGDVRVLLGNTLPVLKQIVDHVKINDFRGAHECWKNSKFAANSWNANPTNKQKINLSHMDQLLEMIYKCNDAKDIEAKKKAADELFDYVHKNVTKSEATLSEPDDPKKMSFEGEVDLAKLKDLYKKLIKLDGATAQYDKVHELVKEFKIIRDVAMKQQTANGEVGASDLD